MQHEQRVKRIRQSLVSGALPKDLPDRIWGGPANGCNVCAACGEIISKRTLEIEALCVDGLHRFYHSACHSLLSLEREKLGDGDAIGASG